MVTKMLLHENDKEKKRCQKKLNYLIVFTALVGITGSKFKVLLLEVIASKETVRLTLFFRICRLWEQEPNYRLMRHLQYDTFLNATKGIVIDSVLSQAS